MKDEIIDRIDVTTKESTADQRCMNCEFAETHDIVHGSVMCMYMPGNPVAHSSDHVCMCFKLGSKR